MESALLLIAAPHLVHTMLSRGGSFYPRALTQPARSFAPLSLAAAQVMKTCLSLRHLPQSCWQSAYRPQASELEAEC